MYKKLALVFLFLSMSVLRASEAFLISNYPEEIKEPGLIAQELCTHDVRILYYHKSVTSKPLELGIMVKNESRGPIEFRVIKVVAGPDEDGLYSGHRITYDYFDRVKKNKTETFTLLPGRSLRVLSQSMKEDHVSVGMIKLSPVKNAPFLIKLWVIDPQNDASALNIPTATKKYNYGFFNRSDIHTDIEWNPNELIKDLVIGDKPYFTDNKHQIELKGNYGILYSYKVALVNMGQKPQKISLYVSPAGGVARGVMEVDNRLIETGFFQKNNQYEPEKVFEWDLPPGHVRFASIKTMPQPGSFYPVHFVLRRDMAK